MATPAVTSAPPTSAAAAILAARPGCPRGGGNGSGAGTYGGGASTTGRDVVGASGATGVSPSSATTTSCAPPGLSSTARVAGCRPGADSTTVCCPADRSRKVNGVRPYACPSTVTLAPGGSLDTVSVGLTSISSSCPNQRAALVPTWLTASSRRGTVSLTNFSTVAFLTSSSLRATVTLFLLAFLTV